MMKRERGARARGCVLGEEREEAAPLLFLLTRAPLSQRNETTTHQREDLIRVRQYLAELAHCAESCVFVARGARERELAVGLLSTRARLAKKRAL
jgi:hypothetical protein